MKDKIILDVSKVSNVNRTKAEDNLGNKDFASFKSKSQELFGQIHENGPKAIEQLNMDLERSKIIIDNNGERTTCSSIDEFLAHSQMLTKDQQNYILNVGQQGLFGGGSINVPVSTYLLWFNDISAQDGRSKATEGSDDVPLCVEVKI